MQVRIEKPLQEPVRKLAETNRRSVKQEVNAVLSEKIESINPKARKFK